jgi:hypothetical protein
MKKSCLIFAVVALTSLVQANTCTVLNAVKVVNSTYNCDLTPTLAVGNSQLVTGCTFSFNDCKSTSWGGSLLYCKIDGITIGTLTKTATSWSCTLDTTGLDTLNSCVSSGSKCDFDVTCKGGWSIGSCTATYDCGPNPKPKTVPDAASTASLLSLGLAGAALLRRKLA